MRKGLGRVSAAIAAFACTPLDEVLGRHLREDPRAAAVALFHAVAASVPAYGRFLAEQGVDPGERRTFDDFLRVPPVTKAELPPPAPARRRSAAAAASPRAT